MPFSFKFSGMLWVCTYVTDLGLFMVTISTTSTEGFGTDNLGKVGAMLMNALKILRRTAFIGACFGFSSPFFRNFY